MSSDDNGQDLANYNFATDGFRVNPANPEVCTLYTHFMIFITIDLIKKVCQKILNQKELFKGAMKKHSNK